MNKSKLLNSAVGLTAGAGIGIALNSAIPTDGNTFKIAKGAQIFLGLMLAASKKSNPMYLAGGFGLAAEGATELIAAFTNDAYTPPSLTGFPGAYISPGSYYPYRMNGVGALGDAGVTEHMRY